ncbi:MAG TPA: GNAT family N-acetyltransferase [Candidatus Limnocylindria bacterium]
MSAPGRDVGIRLVRAGEWEALRELRLRALTDTPDAFSTTMAQARARSEVEWREAARGGSVGERQATFVADGPDGLIGMVTAFLDEPSDSAVGATLIQMWVAPAARRAGVGRALVEALLAWCAQRGARGVRLSVNATLDRPIAFYEALGFQDTGAREPLFPERGVLAMEMQRPTDSA